MLKQKHKINLIVFILYRLLISIAIRNAASGQTNYCQNCGTGIPGFRIDKV